MANLQVAAAVPVDKVGVVVAQQVVVQQVVPEVALLSLAAWRQQRASGHAVQLPSQLGVTPHAALA